MVCEIFQFKNFDASYSGHACAERIRQREWSVRQGTVVLLPAGELIGTDGFRLSSAPGERLELAPVVDRAVRPPGRLPGRAATTWASWSTTARSIPEGMRRS